MTIDKRIFNNVDGVILNIIFFKTISSRITIFISSKSYKTREIHACVHLCEVNILRHLIHDPVSCRKYGARNFTASVRR